MTQDREDGVRMLHLQLPPISQHNIQTLSSQTETSTSLRFTPISAASAQNFLCEPLSPKTWSTTVRPSINWSPAPDSGTSTLWNHSSDDWSSTARASQFECGPLDSPFQTFHSPSEDPQLSLPSPHISIAATSPQLSPQAARMSRFARNDVTLKNLRDGRLSPTNLMLQRLSE
ncbi:hypothetical protein HGRIS_001051 [Hohenbuehelia grisea]|uniref:Uncharacterized protein n=1 Tax=Hohenbuehelia grisea TaxID=104357 RepID=A0ABR3JNB8_9AGAR